MAAEVDAAGLAGAAVMSAVGSFSTVVYTLPEVLDDGSFSYVGLRRCDEPLSIVSLSGHFGRDAAGGVRHHLHSAFALNDGRVLGGHLFEGVVLVTAEITMLPCEPWDASPGIEVDGRQAWMLSPKLS